MKIKSSSTKKRTAIAKIWNISNDKAFFLILFILTISFVSFLLGGIIQSKMWRGLNNVKAVVANSYKVPEHFINGLLSAPKEILLDIKHVDLQNLYYTNYFAINFNDGLLNTLSSESNYVPIKLTENGTKISGKARIKGNFFDSRSNEKLSLRIKLKQENTIMGMKKFSIHDPKVKNFMSEWLFYKMLDYEDLITS